MTGVVVFAGPTLPMEDVAALLPAIVLPPARQGDVWRAVQAHRPRAIGLIDGVFLHEPAVWHRELLWAMHRGVAVFGAASMGALRAAELAAFGMRGVGRVFEAYRDGVWPGYDDAFEDDDEVAVTHAPAELGAMPLSVAMVDVRDTLQAAVVAGVLDRAGRDALFAAMKQLPFPQRTWSTLGGLATRYPAFPAWLPAGRVARKRLDAVQMLHAMTDFLAGDPPAPAIKFQFQQPQVWADFLTTTAAPLSDDESLVMDELQLDPAAWHAAARAGLGRLQSVANAPPAPPGSDKAQTTRFRHARGLARRADVDAWLAANAATPADLSRLMLDEAALDAALADPPPALPGAMLDHLRLCNGFAALLCAARAKQAALDGQTPLPGELDRAMAWHRARLRDGGGLANDSTATFTLPHAPGFRYAVWRAYKEVNSGDS